MKSIRIMAVSILAFLFIAAFPLAVSAAPAITNLSIDRTTITSGQNITFNIRTTSQTNFVFAMTDGVRAQGTRVTNNSNDWTVTVWPSRTTTVTIFVNSSNNESGAATMNIPVTVSGTTTTTTQQTVAIPPAPPNLGPVAIASITETPATAQGFVQLTVVTGAETQEVWVNFDRVNNVRATGSFRRGTMLRQDTNSKTWVIDFPLAAWTPQTVEVGSNRTYNWPGAATQTHTLMLSQPFVTPVTPVIRSVNASQTNVASGGRMTFTIGTNLDAEHVWIRDIDGREFTASRTTSSATTRNWTVDFSPTRTGAVTIFANATRTETNAATRTETITVGGHGSALIVGTPTAEWTNNDNLRITVTTNNQAERVWATMPNGNRVQLHRTNSGSGNRNWSIDTWTSTSSGNIVIGVSTSTGNINNLNPDDTRTISTWGSSSSGHIFWAEHEGSTTVSRGSSIFFTVRTTSEINDVAITGTGVQSSQVVGNWISIGSNQREWTIRVNIHSNANLGNFRFHVDALRNGSFMDTVQLVNTTITT